MSDLSQERLQSLTGLTTPSLSRAEAHSLIAEVLRRRRAEPRNSDLVRTGSECNSCVESYREIDRLESESATLRRELAAMTQRAEAAEARPCVENCMQERAEGNGGCGACALCCKEQRERAEVAESALSEARKESAGARAAALEEAARLATAEDRAWMDEAKRAGSKATEQVLMAKASACGDVALKLRALAASPRETAPAAAPARCAVEQGGVNGARWKCGARIPCPHHGRPAAAPHNPQSNRSTNNEE